MKPYQIPGHYKPSTRKQSALATTFMMQVSDCDHTMGKYFLTAEKEGFGCIQNKIFSLRVYVSSIELNI
jgi:hypothetical protein